MSRLFRGLPLRKPFAFPLRESEKGRKNDALNVKDRRRFECPIYKVYLEGLQ